MNRKQRRANEKTGDTERSVAIAHYQKAVELYRANNFGAAYQELIFALQKDSKNESFLFLYGVLSLRLGRRMDAFQTFVKLVNRYPQTIKYAVQLTQAAAGLILERFDENIKKTILLCLKSEQVETQKLMRLWFQIVTLDPQLKALLELPENKEYCFKKLAKDPFFTTGLASLITQNQELEQHLTLLRKLLLHDVINAQNNPPIELITAMAQHCFLNEYVFYVDAEETALLETLKKAIGIEPSSEQHLAAFAMYEGLNTLNIKQEVIETLNKGSLKNLITQQINEPLSEMGLIQNIIRIGNIEDKISKDVQDMYEQNPYPRWNALLQSANICNDEGIRYLIAGCGTGRSTCSAAASLPNAKITGIDLSLASMAYGQRKVNELGLKNVTFKQADILNLKALGESYDVIECTGVIHHMDSPVEGWRALLDVLASGGRMFIALYGKKARKHIFAAQNFAKTHGYKSDVKDIRAFRHAIASRPNDAPEKIITGDFDFYTTSNCRDMCFHVQECSYDLEDIRDMMEELGLEWNGLQPLFPEVITLYINEYPDDPFRKNIDNWIALEKRHPEVFVGMYQFWCYRKGEEETDNSAVHSLKAAKVIP